MRQGLQPGAAPEHGSPPGSSARGGAGGAAGAYFVPVLSASAAGSPEVTLPSLPNTEPATLATFLRAVAAHSSDPHVQLSGLRSVVGLSEAVEDRAPLLACLPWIASTLTGMGLRDVEVAQAGVMALIGISQSDGTEEALLPALPSVIAMVRVHLEEYSVAKACLSFFNNLSVNEDTLMPLMAALPSIQAIGTRYALDPALVLVVLEVVQALALKDENCPTLLGAVPGIVGAMERHPADPELVATAMTTMKNMLTVAEVQAPLLRIVPVLPAVESAIRTHIGQQSLVAAGMELLYGLSLADENKVPVMAALDVAILAMETYSEDVNITKYGFLMLESLAVNDDNCVALMRGLPLLETALAHFEDEELEEVVGVIVGTLKNLSTVEANQFELFEFAPTVAAIMEEHSDVEGLVHDALDFFACLSLHDDLQERLVSHVPAVIAAIEANEEDPEAVERGLRCIRNLAVNDANRVPLMSALQVTTAALNNHGDVEDLVVEAVVFLCALSFAEENLPVLRNEDIGNLVASVVQRYPDNEEIEEFGPRLISNL